MRFFLHIILRNIYRQKLRNSLTLTGFIVAIIAFGLLRTVVDAWYAGVEATSASRLVTRHAISLVFDLPIAYSQRIRQVSGVSQVSYANWFGGVYITERNFFPQFAIEPETYLPLYPEYVMPDAQRLAFLHDRQGVMVGRKIAEKFGWKLGDVIPIKGTIYPGTWNFVIRAIYQGIDSKTDESQFLFHWKYLNERMKQAGSARAEHVGVYIVGLKQPELAATVSQAIDALFHNSLAETLTETEKAFQLSFVAMTKAIVVAIQIVSVVIIIIILAVMANTLAMSVRERKREYATLRALGFGLVPISALILGEALILSLSAGSIGILVTFPVAAAFARRLGSFFPVFEISEATLMLSGGIACGVGIVAALPPIWQTLRTPVTQGLKHIG